MKCQYEKIDSSVKCKIIYKYFFNKLKSNSSTQNTNTSISDIDTYSKNYLTYPWINMKFHKIGSNTNTNPKLIGNTINLFEIKNTK